MVTTENEVIYNVSMRGLQKVKVLSRGNKLVSFCCDIVDKNTCQMAFRKPIFNITDFTQAGALPVSNDWRTHIVKRL